jgi:lysophospholipid acyltransferase (LPLAT)-like uncharacterized protein
VLLVLLSAETPIPARKLTVPHRTKWHGNITALSAFVAVKTLAATWRISWEDRGPCLDEKQTEPLLFCIWHNRLALSMVFWDRVARVKFPAAGLTALISASKDGALLARTLQYFHVQPVRGSSSRRGAQALRELTSWVEKGYHAAITPDGPRGPRYVLQEGIILLAQLTGYPIIPVGAKIHRKFRLRSWDQFQVPLPFARCDLILDMPFYVPAEISPEQREQFRTELEKRMVAINAD